MITHSDDGPEFEPDDPLAVILRPSSDHLGPPPGRYEAIRRGAARRRMLRAAAGVGLAACAVTAAVVLPLRLAAPDAPASPTVPLAPPPASSPSAPPTPSASPSSASQRPTEAPSTDDSPGPQASRAAQDAVPSPSAPSTTPTSACSQACPHG